MNITTLNVVSLDDGRILKKGGATPTPPSGGADKTLYFDVSNVDPDDREEICGSLSIIVSDSYVGPASWVLGEIVWLKYEINKIGVTPCMAGFPYDEGIIELTSDMIREGILGLGATEISKAEFYPTMLKKGVFIQHIDGTLYREWEWAEKGFSGDEANGVAVISDEASFVIAKDSLGEMPWSSNNVLIGGVTTTTNEDEAFVDFAGEANTTKIASVDHDSAASKCMNFTFPNGQKGYLPSFGELAIWRRVEFEVEDCMMLIGGDTTNQHQAWSSTQCSTDEAWYIAVMGVNDFSAQKKVWDHKVRPVCSLKLK